MKASEAAKLVRPYLGTFHPFIPAGTSVNWYNSPKSAASGTIDLSAEFGVPAYAKAVALCISLTGGTVGTFSTLSAVQGVGGQLAALTCRVQVAGVANDNAGIVPCGPTGDVYFYQSNPLSSVYIALGGWFE